MNRDRGSATLVVVFMLMLVLALVALGGAGLRVAGARGTASTAADLAALAAADALDCGVAQNVAAANGAQLEACRLQGADYVVEVSVDILGLPGGPRKVTASARAGPATTGRRAVSTPILWQSYPQAFRRRDGPAGQHREGRRGDSGHSRARG
ncbi:MAG: flp pilus-assembly TadE/G-like family protein [Candidatus Nanopelagicales bacterium]|nr:flp pilus-assembly TadE/G-like family protein [Candidatus Nanopelagicales bacterium]